jgi:hypothetical protein
MVGTVTATFDDTTCTKANIYTGAQRCTHFRFRAIYKEDCHLGNINFQRRAGRTIMAESEVKNIISQLESLKANQLSQAPHLLSRAKLGLLKLGTLVPTEESEPKHLHLAVSVLELGALISIRLKDTDAFTRYYQQLQPFYALEVPDRKEKSNQSKVTGLYLLLLLSVGDYGGFHTVLEGLEAEGQEQLNRGEFIQYPVRLEQALMEGSYDKVWGETKRERVPSEEFAVFSEVREHMQEKRNEANTRSTGSCQYHSLRNCVVF